MELNPDDHLVAHDLAIAATGAAASVTGLLAGLSAWTCLFMGLLLDLLGVALMRIGPTRRGLNRAIATASQGLRR